jgi:hypothetical protein
MPEGPTFGGGATESVISPLALILLLLFWGIDPGFAAQVSIFPKCSQRSWYLPVG